jgi:hypothetical protein
MPTGREPPVDLGLAHRGRRFRFVSLAASAVYGSPELNAPTFQEIDQPTNAAQRRGPHVVE